MVKGQKAMMCQRHGAAWMAHNLGEHLVRAVQQTCKNVIGLMWIDDLESYEPLWLEITAWSATPGELSGNVIHWNDNSLGPG